MTVGLAWDFVDDLGSTTSDDCIGVCKLGGSGVILLVNASGIVRASGDAGATWVTLTTLTGLQLPIIDSFTMFAPQSATDTAFIFVYPTSQSGAILRTTDGGTTWTSVYSVPNTHFSNYGYSWLDLGSGVYWCAGAWTGAAGVHDECPILATSDGGASWTRFGALANWDHTHTYSIGDQVAYAGFAYESLTNSNLNKAPNIFTSDWVVLVGHPSTIDNSGAIFSGLLKTSSGRIIVAHAGLSQLFYSDDTGASWAPANDLDAYIGSDFNTIYWTTCDMGGSVLLAAPCGGISAAGGATRPLLFRSTDDGTNWAPVDVGATSGHRSAWLTRVQNNVAVFAFENDTNDSSLGWKVSEDGGATWMNSTTAVSPLDGSYWWPMAQMVISAVDLAAQTAQIVAVGANMDLSNGHGQVWFGTLTNLPLVITYGMEIWRGTIADPCGAPDDPTGLPEQGVARRYATSDLDAGGVFFSRGITREPTVSKALVETLWGQLVTETATLELALDAILLQGYLQDQRGQQFALELYDKASGFRQSKLEGVTTSASIRAGAIAIEGQNFDPSIFEEVLPRGRITTDEFPNAVDLGESITKVLGNVAQVPCRYINDNVLDSEFDYLVARGVVSVPYVFRVGPSGGLMNVHPEEYIVSTTLYPCYTVLRFLLRQTDTNNALIPIYADVVGDPDERNLARAIQAFCSDTRWALGKTVDEASFDTAAALLEPAASGLIVDGALIGPDQAQNYLAELFQFAGIRMRITSAGAIAISVDTGRTGVRFKAEDGVGTSTHTLLNPQRTKTKLQDATRHIVMRYRQDMRNPDKWFFEQSRVVNADLGKDKEYRNRFIRDHRVADVVTDRLGKRLFYAEDQVSATLPQAGRGLQPGDLIDLTYPLLGLNADTFEVTRLGVARRSSDVALAGWDSSIYSYTPGTLPSESTGGGGRVDDPVPPPGAPPPDDTPTSPDSPPEQPPGFPSYDWGSVGMRAFQFFADPRGRSTADGAAASVAANTHYEVVLPSPAGMEYYFSVRPGSVRIYENPTIMTHPDTGKIYAIAQAGVSQRITDDSAGFLVGDTGSGTNAVDYFTGVVAFSFGATGTTPFVILYERVGLPTPVL